MEENCLPIFRITKQQKQWRSPTPKSSYDAVIVGGGGHGLATAYYLAKEHGMRNIAVVERGWLGGGNTARNTTIVRSNYMIDGNTNFYEHSMKLWEDLSRDLNFNVMFSQRGQINLAQSIALTVIVVDTISAVLALALIVQIKRRTGTLDAADLARLRH